MFNINEYEFYNEGNKKQYLNDLSLNENSKKVIASELARAGKVEKQFDKDLFAFNDLEVQDLIMSLGASTELTLRGIISIYKRYIDWAISKGVRGRYENGINELANFQNMANITDYVSNSKVMNRFVTEEEFMDFLDILVNPMDQLAVALPYNFIVGDELEEIRAIRIEDLDVENNILTVRDENNSVKRKQVIPKYLVNLIEETSGLDIYILNNGEESNTPVKERKLADTPYLVRPLRTKKNAGLKATYGFIQAKYVKIKDYVGLEYEMVTPLTLRTSRVFNMITKVMEEKGEVIASTKTFREVFNTIKKDYGWHLTEMQEYNLRVSFKKYNAISRGL